MALNIATEEADRLAQELSRLTGESVDDAVTKALAERLERERGARIKRTQPTQEKDLHAKLAAFRERVLKNYDLRPVTKEDWDAMWGDDQ